MTTVAIVQSNYLPWKGYFDLIAAADLFVVYDCVQYTVRDWRNRNRIKGPEGHRWLSVPVRRTSRDMLVSEAVVLDRDILRKHWDSIRQVYGEQPGFAAVRGTVEPWFDRDAPTTLSQLNVQLLRSFCGLLGIETPIVDSAEFELRDGRTERLAGICQQAGADRYLSGPAARSYLDESVFATAGIDVEWMSYDGYPEYDQPYPPFDHHVSIVDLVLSVGEGAEALMLHRSRA